MYRSDDVSIITAKFSFDFYRFGVFVEQTDKPVRSKLEAQKSSDCDVQKGT
jgi:hypothetical protein